MSVCGGGDSCWPKQVQLTVFHNSGGVNGVTERERWGGGGSG